MVRQVSKTAGEGGPRRLAGSGSGLLVAALLIAAQAQAQPALDARPQVQDADEVAAVFGVEVDGLPEGSVWQRLRGRDGRTDSLQMEIPVSISVIWSEPAAYSVTCPAMLTISRTGLQPGPDGLPAGIQVVMAGSGGLGGGFIFPVVDGEAVNGRLLSEAEMERYDLTAGPPAGVAASPVALPAPACHSLMEIGSNISGADVLGRPEVQADLAELEPEERQRATDALMGLQTILGPGFEAGTGYGSIEELQQAACFAQAVPVVQIVDPSPANFHLIFSGTVEGPDEALCPLVSARGQIHAGAPIDDGVLQVVSYGPEPVILRGPDQNTVECTNNDPAAPVVDIRFSQPVSRRSLAGNVRLMALRGTGWEDTGQTFTTDGQGLVHLEPGTALFPLTRYRVEVTGGANGVLGLDPGQVLDDGFSFEFQTAPASDSGTFQSLYGDAVDFHAYQGSRDAPVLPGRPVVLRSRFEWPPERDRHDSAAMPDRMCVRLDAAEVGNARGTPARFDRTEFPFPRIDTVSAEMRRLGIDRALTTGWTPGRGEPRDAQLEMTVGLVNFTSADAGRESPQLTYTPERTLQVLPNPVTIPVRLFTLAFDDAADLDDAVLAGEDAWVNISNQSLGNRDRLNSGAVRLADYIATDWALVESAGQRYLPLNRMTLSRSGRFEMRGVGVRQVVTNDEGEEEVRRIRGGADNGAADLAILTVQIEEFYRRVILPACVGPQICLGSLPIPYGGARAFYDADSRHRGFLIGLDSLPYQHRIPAVTAHEIGHTFGLAHVPNDYNRRGEQNRIVEEVANIRRRGPLRWPDIDQVMIWPDGHVGYRHSEDGNSEHRDLWPLMYNTALDPLEGGIQMDQYLQVMAAMRNPRSTNSGYYGPQQGLSRSSSESVEAVLVEMHRVRWRETVGDTGQALPTYRYVSEGETPGLLVGFGISGSGESLRIPYRPMLSAMMADVGDPETLPAGGGPGLRADVLDEAGQVLASRTLDGLPDAGDAPVWLDVFLALDLDVAPAVREVRLVNPHTADRLAGIPVAAVEPLGSLEAGIAAGVAAVRWAPDGSDGDIRLFWQPDGGEAVMIGFGRDRGGIAIPVADLAGDGVSGPGRMIVERTNGVIAYRASAALDLPEAAQPEPAAIPVPGPVWQIAEADAGPINPDLHRQAAREQQPVPVLVRRESPGEEISGPAVEPGYTLETGGDEPVLVRTPVEQGCALSAADLDIFVDFQTAAIPEEMRGPVAAEIRADLEASLTNPAYDRRGLCDAVRTIREGN